MILACVAFTASAGAMQTSQPAPSPAGDADPVDALLAQPPTDAAEDQPRLQLAAERIGALTAQLPPQDAPPEQSATPAVEALQALVQAWTNYRAELERLSALRADVESLQSEARMNELAARLADLQRRIDDARRPSLAQPVSEERIAELTRLQNELDAELTTLSAAQTRRAALLAGGVKQKREQLDTELADLRQRLADRRVSTDTESLEAAQRTALERDIRRLNVQIARNQVGGQVLTLETRQAELRAKQDEPYVEALREAVSVVRRRTNALTESKRRDTLESLEARIQATDSPVERARLEMEYFGQRVLLRYFKTRTLPGAAKPALAAQDLDRLRDRITFSAVMWSELAAALDEGQTYQNASDLRAELRQERRTFERESARIQGALARAMPEVKQLKQVREKTTARMRELGDALSAKLSDVDPDTRTRLDTEVTNLHAGLNEAMAKRIDDAQGFVSRLREANRLLEEHLGQLNRIDGRIHRHMLLRRDSGFAGVDFSAVRRELSQIVGIESAAPERSDSVSVVGAAGDELFPPAPAAGAKMRSEWRRHAAALGALSGRAWTGIIGLTVAAALIGVGLRRFARHLARPAADELEHIPPVAGANEEQPTGASARIRLLFWQVVRGAAIPVLVALALWGGTRMVGLDPATRAALVMLIAYPVAVSVAMIFAGALFPLPQASPRAIDLSPRVRVHYRFWSRVLIVFCAVVLVWPMLLFVLDAAPGLRGLLREVFKTGVLVILLAFLSRRNRVLGSNPTGRRHLVAAAVSVFYPLIVVAVAGLLVLQLIGYGVLVEFIGGGVLASAAIVLAIFGLVEYLCDVLDHYAHGPVTSGGPGGSGVDVEAPLAGSVGRIGKSIVRLAGGLLAIFVLLAVWGVDVTGDDVDWSVVMLTLGVVVGAVIVDRVLFTTMHTLHVTGRMPETTANMIRRWSRTLLAVVTVLAVIALAGYQVTNLWTFLTTLVAMLAVGFVAVWSVLSNIMATLIILFWKPFNIGEQIDIQPEGITGRAVDINFMYTLLRGENGELTTVPNSLFMQKFIRRTPAGEAATRSLAEQLESTEALADDAPAEKTAPEKHPVGT